MANRRQVLKGLIAAPVAAYVGAGKAHEVLSRSETVRAASYSLNGFCPSRYDYRWFLGDDRITRAIQSGYGPVIERSGRPVTRSVGCQWAHLLAIPKEFV